jgi:hypothetical protein
VCQRLATAWGRNGGGGSGACEYELPLDAGEVLIRGGQTQAVNGAVTVSAARVAIIGRNFEPVDVILSEPNATYGRRFFAAFVPAAYLVTKLVAYDESGKQLAVHEVGWADT